MFWVKICQLGLTIYATEEIKCIAIVRTNRYNIARKGNTKIFERSVTLWQQNQLICT